MSVLEKSDLRITDWHQEACWVMKNGDREGQIFLCYPHANLWWIIFLIQHFFFIFNPLLRMLYWENWIISINNSNYQIFSKNSFEVSIVLKVSSWKMGHLLNKCSTVHIILENILHFKDVLRHFCGVKD